MRDVLRNADILAQLTPLLDRWGLEWLDGGRIPPPRPKPPPNHGLNAQRSADVAALVRELAATHRLHTVV